MLPTLELNDLTALQRKLLVDLVRRNHTRFWSHFTSDKYSWQRQKESLEEFIQNHSYEFVKELAKAGLHNNGWKTARRCRVHV
jgi:hypothetical protein